MAGRFQESGQVGWKDASELTHLAARKNQRMTKDPKCR